MGAGPSEGHQGTAYHSAIRHAQDVSEVSQSPLLFTCNYRQPISINTKILPCFLRTLMVLDTFCWLARLKCFFVGDNIMFPVADMEYFQLSNIVLIHLGALPITGRI